jgi:hypothetical protein
LSRRPVLGRMSAKTGTATGPRSRTLGPTARVAHRRMARAGRSSDESRPRRTNRVSFIGILHEDLPRSKVQGRRRWEPRPGWRHTAGWRRFARAEKVEMEGESSLGPPP